jgi:hypothetical protein
MRDQLAKTFTYHQASKSGGYVLHILAGVFVGGTISGAGDRGSRDYRQECQESFRSKSIDMVWLWKVFSQLITVGS